MANEAWQTAGVIVMMLTAMVSGRIAADVAVMGALLMLLLLGIVEPAEAISGFANPAVATIGLLYVVAVGLKETGATTALTSRLLGQPTSIRQAQFRLLAPVGVLSAFTNNTPLIAAMLPVLSATARRAGIAASQLFMPLSFAAILGGMCTLIGTSTNLVVAGLLQEANKAGQEVPTFSMFTLARAGVPAAIVGMVYILVFGRRLLRANEERRPGSAVPRQYMTAMRVEQGSPIVGKTVEKAGLRRLPGLFLSRIDRGDAMISAVGPMEMLREGDTLVFVGDLDSVVDLQQTRGLTPVADESETISANRARQRLIEVVISPASPLIGSTIRDAAIRTRYSAVVIGVHRHGHRLDGRIGDITIRAGDTLLLESGLEFARRYRDSNEFTLVSELEGAAAPHFKRAPAAIGVLLGLIFALSFGVIDPMTGAMLAAALMVLGRCCSTSQARAGIDWQVLIVIGAAFGIGHALQNSGLAPMLADWLLAAAGSGGPVTILLLIYAATLGFTMLISNTAAAVLMFPVAMDAAREAHVNLLPVAVCVALAASADFSTPLGYQTNLMVMGPGGYRWIDFLRFGGPLSILVGLTVVASAATFYGPLGTGG